MTKPKPILHKMEQPVELFGCDDGYLRWVLPKAKASKTAEDKGENNKEKPRELCPTYFPQALGLEINPNLGPSIGVQVDVLEVIRIFRAEPKTSAYSRPPASPAETYHYHFGEARKLAKAGKDYQSQLEYMRGVSKIAAVEDKTLESHARVLKVVYDKAVALQKKSPKDVKKK